MSRDKPRASDEGYPEAGGSKVVESAKRKPPAAGKGRKKGSKNKTTKALKDAILQAFNEVGGVSYLKTVAIEDPKTFCALLGKVLPMTVASDPDQPVKIEVTWAQSGE